MGHQGVAHTPGAARQANVIASNEPLEPGTTTRAYTDAQGAVLAEEMPRFRELSLVPVPVFARGYTATATSTSRDFLSHDVVLSGVLERLWLNLP